MKNGLHIDENGTKRWYFDGKLHCEGGHAEEWLNGTKFWYLHGKCHREDGPAVEWAWAVGTTTWYLNGDCLGDNAVGFWRLWDQLTLEQQNNLNLHMWLAKYV